MDIKLVFVSLWETKMMKNVDSIIKDIFLIGNIIKYEEKLGALVLCNSIEKKKVVSTF